MSSLFTSEQGTLCPHFGIRVSHFEKGDHVTASYKSVLLSNSAMAQNSLFSILDVRTREIIILKQLLHPLGGLQTQPPYLILPLLWEKASQQAAGIWQFAARSFLTSKPKKVLLKLFVVLLLWWFSSPHLQRLFLKLCHWDVPCTFLLVSIGCYYVEPNYLWNRETDKLLPSSSTISWNRQRSQTL